MAGIRTWLVQGLIVLAVLVTIAVAVAYVVGGSRLSQTFDVESVDLTPLPDDSATLAHGEHLVGIHGCADCHGEDLSGEVMVDAPPFRVVAANLTSGAGGIGDDYDAADFDRAIRHGVRPDGRPVIIMPSAAFHALSDEDAAAIIAYIKQVPPVNNELPPTEVRPLGRLMSAFAFDPAMEVRQARPGPGSAPPVRAATPEYGAYLASITCAYCHGQDLRGMQPPMPDAPFAPDLVARADEWSHDQFIETLRTGTTPDGRELDPEFMPYSLTARMDAIELDALYAYLEGLE